MERKRRFNPFTMQTLKRAKVNGVKCYLKAFQQKKVELQQVRGEHGALVWQNVVTGVQTIYYIVCASDGSSRKITDETKTLEAYEQLLEFERRQQTITI